MVMRTERVNRLISDTTALYLFNRLKSNSNCFSKFDSQISSKNTVFAYLTLENCISTGLCNEIVKIKKQVKI